MPPALAVVLLLAACSGSVQHGPVRGGSGGVPTTIAQALASVPVTSWDTTYVEFGEVAKLVSLNGGKPGTGPLTAYVGVGESSLANELPESGSPLGFDPSAVSAAVLVGNEPHQITMVYSQFDAASVGSTLAKEGFKQHGTADGGTLWSVGDDDQLSPDNPTGVPGVNVLLVSSSRIALGGASADVKTIAGGAGKTLLSAGAMGAVAECLGPAVAAVIGLSSAGAQKSSLLGIGLLADSAADAGEELCVTATDAAQASAVSAAWTAQIRTGRSRRVDEPWSALLTDPQSTTLAPVDGVITVRLTAKPAPGARPGVLLEDYYAAADDLDGLLGQS